jgi:hypothetical protein
MSVEPEAPRRSSAGIIVLVAVAGVLELLILGGLRADTDAQFVTVYLTVFALYLLWILLAAILIVAAIRGTAPAWIKIASGLLYPLSAAATFVPAFYASPFYGSSAYSPRVALGLTLLPPLLAAYALLVVRFPTAASPVKSAVILGIAGVLSIGQLGIVAAGLLPSEQARNEQAREEDAKSAAYFANLTDASPLREWSFYAVDDYHTAKPWREAALQRLASRPTLQVDLARELVSSDRDYADKAFLLVARVEFRPSAALEAPLRSAMARIAAEIRNEFAVPFSGNNDTLDSIVRGEYAERLTASLVIATRMADSAGVDLRDGLRTLESAASVTFRQTKTAETYRQDVAAAEPKIEALLRARRKAN